jgi:hypothetical protein
VIYLRSKVTTSLCIFNDVLSFIIEITAFPLVDKQSKINFNVLILSVMDNILNAKTVSNFILSISFLSLI